MNASRHAESGISRLGRWARNPLVSNYLRQIPPEVLLGAAGVLLNKTEPLNNQYWHPRFDFEVSEEDMEELKILLFPFLVRLREVALEVGGNVMCESMS